MLVLNLNRIMNLRGIERVYSFLSANGFVHSTAWKMDNGKLSSIKINQIGQLCVLLNCTPNDLFDWKPDQKNPIGEDHALNTLVKEEISLDLKKLLKDIPVEKLGEVENLLKGLKGG